MNELMRIDLYSSGCMVQLSSY